MNPEAIVNAFLRRAHKDRQCDALGPVEDYQARFPGHEELIAAEYARLLEVDRRSLDAMKPTRELPYGASGEKPNATTDLVMERIGPYRILEKLGEGGMGSVYLAEQKRPVRRRVALKVIKLGMDSKEVLHRFEAERQALAMMEHGNIAHIYEAGLTDRGQPYFAMEYVKGVPIHLYCDSNKLTLQERLQLFRQVCSGVQHAHNKGVIHRDLTPNNILVTLQDGKPTPKIIDFGLARATDHRLVEATIFTEQGRVIGTPEYMSPEQADLDSLDIDTRTDVYTLGVLLYELLIGELPFPSRELRKAGLLEMQRRIREEDPPRPSTRLTTLGESSNEVALRRRTELRTLQRQLRDDLDWVVMMALEKDRTRRYQTVSELAADIERYLQSQPVLAGPPAIGYRARKFLRRYRAQVLAAGLVVAALTAGVVTTTWGLLRERAQSELTKQERERADGKVREFEQLAGVVRLQRALKSEESLYPARPERIPAMQQWLDDEVGPLLATRPQLEATVLELRVAEETAPAEEEAHARESRRFLMDTLTELIEEFARLENTQVAAVRDRVLWAQHVERLSLDEHASRWREARDAIRRADGETASTLYRDPPIDLTPQMGLVPIGMNPVTKLWEFYHLRSAGDWRAGVDGSGIEIPAYDETGAIDLGAKTGLVFVLLPGGRTEIGSQRGDANSPRFDPRAADNEAPPQTVQVAPFLLSKYEMTQAQWQALSAENPSRFHPNAGAPVYWTNPVEYVDWRTCSRLLEVHVMTLPTEAQWEFGCRAGTQTAWWPGDDRGALQEPGPMLNIADQATVRARMDLTAADDWKSYDDGWPLHAPAGSFPANRFGLHEVHGNVWEWCSDAYADRRGAAGPTPSAGAVIQRVVRGGSWFNKVDDARSSRRKGLRDTDRFDNVGLRPARLLRSP